MALEGLAVRGISGAGRGLHDVQCMDGIFQVHTTAAGYSKTTVKDHLPASVLHYAICSDYPIPAAAAATTIASAAA